MELQGDSVIAAPRATVWAALNDADVLARCIDGVETLAKTIAADGATRLDGKMNARVGPVRATFAGGVTLTQVDEPNRYVLVGEGKGGVAGFAKGEAEIVLSDVAEGTRLAYTVRSSVGGKLAQLGARLIEGTARGYAETFFTRFKAEVEMPTTVAPDAASPIPALDVAPLPATAADIASIDDARILHDSRPRSGLTPLIWAGVLIVIVLAVLVWQLS